MSGRGSHRTKRRNKLRKQRNLKKPNPKKYTHGKSNKSPDRSRPAIISFTNVGSICSTAVKRQLLDGVTKIRNTFGGVDMLCVQEVMDFDASLPPAFGKPTADDAHVTLGADDRGRRGVATFLAREDQSIGYTHKDLVNEICVEAVSYCDEAGKEHVVAVLNCYRNQSEHYERSVQDTKEAILSITQDLVNNYGISEHIIIGDFNTEELTLPGYNELTCDAMFHQKSHNCQKRYIDKAFANLPEAGILCVDISCENIHGSTQDSSQLGHKLITLHAGRHPSDRGEEQAFVVPLGKLKKAAGKKKFLFNEIGSDTDEAGLEEIAVDFTNKMVSLYESVGSVKIRKKRPRQRILIEQLENAADNPDGSTNPWKLLYEFNDAIKSQQFHEVSPSSQVTPPIDQLADHLNKKVADLNQVDSDLGRQISNQLFPVNTDRQGVWYGDDNSFKRLIRSINDSNAKDKLGISPKVMKIMLLRNAQLRKRLQSIYKHCLILGYFPAVWKFDRISFLFKGGARSDTGRYRPITIAIALGKGLEKVMAKLISNMPLGSPNNHAYQKSKSVLSAIVDAQRKLNELERIKLAHLEKEKNDPDGDQHEYMICIVMDDLEGAFEGVPHELITNAIRRCYAGDARFKIADLFESYLDRKQFGLDQVTGETAVIYRTFLDRSIPQGSVISPPMFIMFDGHWVAYATQLTTQVAADQSTPIVAAARVNYADDTLGLVLLRWKVDLEPRSRAFTIRAAINLVRDLAKCAVVRMGGKINKKKSENVVPAQFTENFDEFINAGKPKEEHFIIKSEFKWIGYEMELLPDGRLIFNETKIANKLKGVARRRADFYQFTNNIKLKLQVYRVYFAPFTELYTVLAIQNKENDRTQVHSFQHQSIAAAIGACSSTSYQKINSLIGERSIRDKSIRVARRLCRGIPDSELQIGGDMGPTDKEPAGMGLRSGKAKPQATVSPNERQNFIFRLGMFAKMEPDDDHLDDSGKKKRVDIGKLKIEVKKINENIRDKIRERNAADKE